MMTEPTSSLSCPGIGPLRWFVVAVAALALGYPSFLAGAPRLPTYSVEEPDGEQLYIQIEYPYVRVVSGSWIFRKVKWTLHGDNVIELLYDHKPASLGGRILDDHSTGGYGDLVLLPAAIVLAPVDISRPRITIRYDAPGGEVKFTYLVKRYEVDSLLQELKAVTGKNVRYLPSERQREKILIHFDRKTMVGGQTFRPGAYHLVLTNKPESSESAYARLYREGRVYENKLLAEFPVKVVKEKNSVHEPETVYSFQIGEKYALSEVRTAKTTIKFR